MNSPHPKLRPLVTVLPLCCGLLATNPSPASADALYVRESVVAAGNATTGAIAQPAVPNAPNAIPQPAPPTVATAFQFLDVAPDSARKFLALSQNRKAFQTPIDLEVKEASVEEVVAQVEKVLAQKKVSIPTVTVKDVLPVRLNFAVKGSTVGAVLNSTAILAGARLWLLDDYTLLAPSQSLSPDELALSNQGLISDWTSQSSSAIPNIQRQKAFSSFIAQEVQNKGIQMSPSDLLPNGQLAGRMLGGMMPSNPENVRTVMVSQLSPDSQAMLGVLVADINDRMILNHAVIVGIPPVDPFVLTPDAPLRFNAEKTGSIDLVFPARGGAMSWSVNGSSSGISFGPPPRRPSSPTPQAPMPLDLSAGKS